MDPHATSLAVRWLHVAAMAVALGGSVLVLLVANGPDRAATRAVAERYEWAFWAAVGMLAMTGIGNLAAFGGGLPASNTAWGTTLLVKLGIVIVVAVLSVPRTLAVSRLTSTGSSEARAVVLRIYSATALTLASTAALAVLLAHGS